MGESGDHDVYESQEHGVRMEFERTQELPEFSQRSQALEVLSNRISVLEQQHSHLEAKIATNTLITSSVKDDTAALVELFKNLQAVGSAFVWVGKFSKWVTTVAAAFVVIWAVVYFASHHVPPDTFGR